MLGNFYRTALTCAVMAMLSSAALAAPQATISGQMDSLMGAMYQLKSSFNIITHQPYTLTRRLPETGGLPSTCDQPQPTPSEAPVTGSFSAEAFEFSSALYTGCLTLKIRGLGTSWSKYSVAVYSPSFDPQNVKTNLIGYANKSVDAGSDSAFMSVNLQAGIPFTVVMWETEPEQLGRYFLTLNDSEAVASDFDGDGQSDSAVFRPSTATWYILQSTTATVRVDFFGSNGDVPLDGDFDGDGKTDVSTFRPSTGAWYYRRSANNSFFATSFGAGTDTPVPGDYDRDGMTDIGIFRPSTGEWYISPASRGHTTYFAHTFGAPGDIPISSQ